MFSSPLALRTNSNTFPLSFMMASACASRSMLIGRPRDSLQRCCRLTQALVILLGDSLVLVHVARDDPGDAYLMQHQVEHLSLKHPERCRATVVRQLLGE